MCCRTGLLSPQLSLVADADGHPCNTCAQTLARFHPYLCTATGQSASGYELQEPRTTSVSQVAFLRSFAADE